MAHGQLRFLSKYFLKKGQILTHGAEIYSGYLGEKDADFIEEIETVNLTRDWLTFQFTLEAIESTFKSKAGPIIEDFIRMQVFDAFVGNNDRHFYNWGVIEDVRYKNDPFFSPIYDSARGLFWNEGEDKIGRKTDQSGLPDDAWIKSYSKKSMPKIGWEKKKNVTHFKQMGWLYEVYPKYRSICHEIINPSQIERVKELLRDDFKPLMSEQRFMLVYQCLLHRYEKLSNIFTGQP